MSSLPAGPTDIISHHNTSISTSTAAVSVQSLQIQISAQALDDQSDSSPEEAPPWTPQIVIAGPTLVKPAASTRLRKASHIASLKLNRESDKRVSLVGLPKQGACYIHELMELALRSCRYPTIQRIPYRSLRIRYPHPDSACHGVSSTGQYGQSTKRHAYSSSYNSPKHPRIFFIPDPEPSSAFTSKQSQLADRRTSYAYPSFSRYIP